MSPTPKSIQTTQSLRRAFLLLSTLFATASTIPAAGTQLPGVAPPLTIQQQQSPSTPTQFLQNPQLSSQPNNPNGLLGFNGSQFGPPSQVVQPQFGFSSPPATTTTTTAAASPALIQQPNNRIVGINASYSSTPPFSINPASIDYNNSPKAPEPMPIKITDFPVVSREFASMLRYLNRIRRRMGFSKLVSELFLFF